MTEENKTEDYCKTNYKNWKDFFENDPDWQKLKSEQSIKTEKLLTKIAFLRWIGADAFSEEAYRKYVKSFNERQV